MDDGNADDDDIFYHGTRCRRVTLNHIVLSDIYRDGEGDNHMSSACF